MVCITIIFSKLEAALSESHQIEANLFRLNKNLFQRSVSRFRQIINFVFHVLLM